MKIENGNEWNEKSMKENMIRMRLHDGKNIMCQD